MNANKLLPKLRFPEFENDGEWEKKTLGECLLKHPEYGINAPAVPYSDKLPTYLRITDISEDGHFLSDEKVSVDRDVTENNYLVEDDIVLARTGASVGKSYKYREKDGRLVFAGFLIRASPNVKKLNSELLFQFLSTTQYWKWVSFISARSGQPGINGNEYSSMPINIPPTKNEQQKIASCLSSLDEVIAANSQKLEALKNHKKGLMQNLFPNCLNYDSYDGMITMIDENQENTKSKNHINQTNHSSDIVPKYRFPEFVNDGEWVEKQLGKIAAFVNEKTQLENLSINNYISTENLLPDYAGVSISSKLPASGNFTKYSKGDVLISNIRPYLKKVWFADKDGACSNDVIVIQAKSIVTNTFLSCSLKNDAFINYIMKGAEGVKMPRGDKDSIREYPILFPKEKGEQQKIASCLSSLDALITAQTDKIEQLKLHKKGLMQGLFPKNV